MTSPDFNFSWAPKAWTLAPAVPAWTRYFANAVPNPDVKDDIRICSGSSSKLWAPSYDDGPSPFTHTVTDYLKLKNLYGTFYTIGSVAIQYPQTMFDTYSAGHEIGIHTWSHPDLRSVADDNQVIAELVYSAKAMYQVTGKIPKYFRPPYGYSNERVRRLAATMGLRSVSFNLDSQDWIYMANTSQVVPGVTANFNKWVAQGVTNQITLQHDIYAPEANAAVASLDILVKAGYTIQPVFKCLGDSSPYGNSVLESFFNSGIFESRNFSPPVQSLNDSLSFGIGNATIVGLENVAAVEITAIPTKSLASRVVTASVWMLLFLFIS